MSYTVMALMAEEAAAPRQPMHDITAHLCGIKTATFTFETSKHESKTETEKTRPVNSQNGCMTIQINAKLFKMD